MIPLRDDIACKGILQSYSRGVTTHWPSSSTPPTPFSACVPYPRQGALRPSARSHRSTEPNEVQLFPSHRQIHDRLVRTSQAVAKKEALVEKLWKKQRRRELIYLRRSELGKRMFGKSQKKYLRKVPFGSRLPVPTPALVVCVATQNRILLYLAPSYREVCAIFHWTTWQPPTFTHSAPGRELSR